MVVMQVLNSRYSQAETRYSFIVLVTLIFCISYCHLPGLCTRPVLLSVSDNFSLRTDDVVICKAIHRENICMYIGCKLLNS